MSEKLKFKSPVLLHINMYSSLHPYYPWCRFQLLSSQVIPMLLQGPFLLPHARESSDEEKCNQSNSDDLERLTSRMCIDWGTFSGVFEVVLVLLDFDCSIDTTRIFGAYKMIISSFHKKNKTISTLHPLVSGEIRQCNWTIYKMQTVMQIIYQSWIRTYELGYHRYTNPPSVCNHIYLLHYYLWCW